MARLISTASVLSAAFIAAGFTSHLPGGAHAQDTPTPMNAWGGCPYDFGVPTQCANVTVPRNWDTKDSGDITVFFSRLRALTPTVHGSIWFLNGGSGVGGACGPGSKWITYLNTLGFHVVLPTFRGTGECRPRLDCPDDPYGMSTPSVACAEYFAKEYGPEGMYNFSITMAARDLGYAVDLLDDTDGAPRYVQGDSFGTFWAQRYLEIFPDQMSAAILESFDVPNRWTYFQAPDNGAWVARRVSEYCAEDIDCDAMAASGADPYVLMQSILRWAEDGTLACNAKLPNATFGPNFRESYAVLIGALASGGPVREVLSAIPSLVYRIARCNDDDVAAITHLWYRLGLGSSSSQPQQENASPLRNPRGGSERFDIEAVPGKTEAEVEMLLKSARSTFLEQEQLPPPPSTVCDISQVVLYGLFFSEGVPHPPIPTKADLISHWAEMVANVPSWFIGMVDLYNAWPRYPLDEYAHKYPNTSIPILFFNGDLDAETPWDNAAFSTGYYKRELTRLRQVPHVGFLRSPLPNTTLTCGLEMITKFVTSNATVIDGSCGDKVVPLDFAGKTEASVELAQQMYNTSNLWDYDGPVAYRVIPRS